MTGSSTLIEYLQIFNIDGRSVCIRFDVFRIEECDAMVACKEYFSVISFTSGFLMILISQSSVGFEIVFNFWLTVNE